MISCVSSVEQVAAMTWKVKCASLERREKRVTSSKTQASVEVGKPGTGKSRLTAEKAELYSLAILLNAWGLVGQRSPRL